MSAGGGGIDVDSLIAGADPVSAESAKPAEVKPAKQDDSQKASKKPQNAPWVDLSTQGKINMPLYVTPETKGMIDFLRQETGVPSQVLLRKIIEPAVRKEAEKIWKGRGGPN